MNSDTRSRAHQALLVLGGDPDLLARRALPMFPEARNLRFVEMGSDGRDKFLIPDAASGWVEMRMAATAAGIELQLISAFRSIAYQTELIRRKLAQGRTLGEILQVTAPPGCSEHHSGRAVDVGFAGCPALDESFEDTPAFRWLRAHAAHYGFRLSYPRENRSGYLYEPWHWCWHRASIRGLKE